MCGSEADAVDAAPRTMINHQEPHHHHLFMDWNKPNDLIAQEQPSFLLHDPPPPPPHHLMLDPSPQTLIHFPSPRALLEEREEEDNDDDDDDEEEDIDPMKEMQFSFAAMQPIDIDPATVPKPNRRNVRISDDPQTVVARRRRERISEKIRILKRIVPGGAKMDTASMLDEAIRYTKFLKRKVKMLQPNHSQLGATMSDPTYLCYYHNSQT